MDKIFKKIWNELEAYIMVVLMAAFIFTVLWGIVSRIVLKSPATWTEELARTLFIWMVFLGISYSTLHGNHIRVKFIADKLFKGKAQSVLNVMINILAFAIFFWLFVNGIKYIDYCSIVKTPAMQAPRSVFVSILPLTGLLMMIRTGYLIIAESHGFLTGKGKKE